MGLKSQAILNSLNIPMQELNRTTSNIGSSYDNNKQIITTLFTAQGDKKPIAEEILSELSRAVFAMMRERETDILKSTTSEAIGLRAQSARSLGSISKTNLCQARNTLVAYLADLMPVLKMLKGMTPAQQLELNVNYIEALNRQANSLYNYIVEIVGPCQSK